MIKGSVWIQSNDNSHRAGILTIDIHSCYRPLLIHQYLRTQIGRGSYDHDFIVRLDRDSLRLTEV